MDRDKAIRAAKLTANRISNESDRLETSTQDASHIFGDGAAYKFYKHPKSGGYIQILQRPSGPASVINLEVPEEFRGQGIGQRLQAEAMKNHPSLMGQVSSKAAATTAYRLGRRPYGNPEATLDDVFKGIDSDSSVNMLTPDAQPKSKGGALELARHTTAVSRADGQVSPSKYLPNVPRQVHADGGKVAFMQGNHPDVPDVVYHGTNRDIRSFDPEAQRNYDIDPKRPDSTDTGWFGKGHYFAPRPKQASYYAEEAARRSQGKGAQVYPVHLSMKNPFVVNMRDSDSGATTLDKALNSAGVPMHPRGYRMPSEQTAALIGMGHDGVIAKREGKTEEIVAFHPNQIKSAIGNQGTFDPTNPDITKADGGEVEIKRDFVRDNPGGEWLEGKKARAAQYPDMKFVVGATTGVIGGRSSMFLPTHILKGIAGLNDEVRAAGVSKYDSLLSDAQEGGFDPDQKGNKVVVAVNHYGQPYLLEGNTRVAVAHSMGIPKVKAEVRYWNGAENVDGPMHPEKVFGMASTNPDITKADGGEVDGGFEVGKKYNGVIPQIKYLPVRAIERQPSQYEVSRVSDDVAKNMDFSEPVEATAFRYGSNNSEDHPSVALQNGHHRLAAAHQTGRPHLPVTITAVNAKGEKLNALKKLSDEIERSIITKADGGEVVVPQKTVKAYKLFRTKGDGKLYPLFVNAEKPVPMGEWIDAEEGEQGKAQGKVKSKLGDLAYRPGWHAGDLPVATHIGGKSSPDLKAPDYRPDNHVWAEVEMPNDVDWQSEANARAKVNKAGQPILNTAHITDQLPKGGFYRYKTNPNMIGNWLIGGSMKVNRVLSDEEVKAINDQAGVADLPRRSEGFAAGGAAMFEGISEHLMDDEGKPMELWHGTTQPEEFEAFDDAKLGRRDAGFYGRGHYLTPEKDTADEYGEDGTVIGPLHAALKNPYVWDVSSDMKAHSTLRDLQSMGIMKEKSKLDLWDNLQSHHVQPFMAEMRKRGHDGVVVKTGAAHLPNGISEVVAFDPKTIKHTEAEAFDPTDPRIRREDGGEVDGNDNFRNWFGNSVTHTDGKPHVFYTGTSKDKDFTSHNVGRHGAWFVRDPAVASEYAEQNDSQGYKRDGWEITKTNTASRVIPAYVKAENPYTGDLPQEVLRDNYKAAQSEWFDTLRAKGHDSWIPASQNGNLVVALKEPQQIKSIFNSGKFDPNQKHMNKAVGGATMGYVPMAALPVSRLAVARAPVQQQQAPVARFSDSLNSLMDTVEGFKKKPDTAVDSPSAASEGHPPQGMSEEALAAYGKLQDAYGQPLNVISTYRDPQKNQDVGGAKGSQHLHGNAYDIDVSNMSYEDRLALADLAWNSGFRGIGFYENSLHFDVGDPRSWGPSYSRDSIPDWAQDWTKNRYGYSGGGSAMDDDNQNTGDNSNVESLSLARSLRNIGSGGGDDRVQGLFEKIAAGQQQAQKAYEMAHSNGEFDDFKIGDTFVYKHSKYPTPMKVTGFSVSRAEAFPQRKRIYNNHVPVLEMENQDAEKKVNKYPVEWFQENLHKYDFVSGKPRAVKAGGGAMDDSGQNGAMENGNAPINFETRPQAGGLLNAGGVRGSAGVLQAQDEAPLEGLPTKIGIPLSGQSVTAGPDPRIRQVARDYMASTGMKYNPPTKYAKVDPIRARRIAAAYEGMKDDPNDPLTKASYDAMIKETMAQYNHAKKAGLKVEFWNPEKQEDPYGASPRLATEDVRKNHHMWVFPTYAGYGSGDPISEDDAKKNPLLQLTGETWNGIPVTVNDVFRAVHDYYGHAKEGVGFRADGEENAWRSHASMYSPLARMAMTSETRGQNSWLNYGPHGEKNRNARTEDTIFAPQKIGVMPHWAHHEGAEDFTLPEDVEAMQRIRSNFDPAVSKALALTRRFTKGGESAINALKSKGK